ncbi:hypothetical protein [Pseudomonas sp. AN-1]|uniref:hypothetical protein n=1 Tax=Pseudomonas sp. AN-1 TaxID=3096605 RepID=UPI002A6ABB11|nr:hypothetical protein [Pseudomonas sp. AN-1]WPP47108.1 hypothetical protein SK095_06875 [Pseudomonas sp. AN-1]
MPDRKPEFELLQRIDQRLERIEDRFPEMERKAMTYGAAAGALAGTLSGAIVSAGLLAARIKLGV